MPGCVGRRRSGTVMRVPLLQPGAAKSWSATATSHALEERVGQFDWVERSEAFNRCWAGAVARSAIYRPCRPRPSSAQTDAFIQKDATVMRLVTLRGERPRRAARAAQAGGCEPF